MQFARRQSVVDVALPANAIGVSAAATRAKALNRLRFFDAIFRSLTRAAAIGVLVILGGVIVSLIMGSLPALQRLRLQFPDRGALESGHRAASGRWRRSTAPS